MESSGIGFPVLALRRKSLLGNEKTKETGRELNDRLEELSYDENNRMFALVGSLCAEHERIAFLAELQLGAHLMLEMTEIASEFMTSQRHPANIMMCL